MRFTGKANNLEIATARQIAELRMKHGRDSDYCTKGGWVAENFNYLPDGNIYCFKGDFNPLVLFAEEATKHVLQAKSFFHTGAIYREYLMQKNKARLFC